jgi:hypothetical protein
MYLPVVMGTVAGVEHTVQPSAQYPWKEQAWLRDSEAQRVGLIGSLPARERRCG